jgi:hypothetical protein
MPINENLAKAWYAWVHATEPTTNFRLGYTHIPTFNIERELDQLASYVYWVGGSAIKEEDSDFQNLALRGLTQVERIRVDLENCPIPDDDKEEINNYLFVTSVLLEELLKLPQAREN